MSGEEVHLTPETLEQYFAVGVPAVINISPSLGARLEIDPHSELLRLITPAQGADPEVTVYERLTIERTAGVVGPAQFVFTVDASEIHYEAYSFLEAILDYLRSGASFRKAVSDALSGQAELLSKRTPLSPEKQAGLWGELDVLEHIIPILGEVKALEAWLGPLAQEHDFGLPHFEAEVKTTTTNARKHIIGSATQLERSPERPLYLISIQLTAGGAGEWAQTLPEKVEAVRKLLDTTRRTFDTHLVTGVGYHDEDEDLYRHSFQLRSIPRAYLVDDDFPAITQPRLDNVLPKPALVSDVRYTVDVTGLTYVEAPAPLDAFVEAPEPA